MECALITKPNQRRERGVYFPSLPPSFAHCSLCHFVCHSRHSNGRRTISFYPSVFSFLFFLFSFLFSPSPANPHLLPFRPPFPACHFNRHSLPPYLTLSLTLPFPFNFPSRYPTPSTTTLPCYTTHTYHLPHTTYIHPATYIHSFTTMRILSITLAVSLALVAITKAAPMPMPMPALDENPTFDESMCPFITFHFMCISHFWPLVSVVPP